MKASASSPPKVSIVLPAKDAEATLHRAVVSMLEQTLADFELILVDDRSTDTTKAIAHSLAKSDDRIRVLSTDSPGGLVSALKMGTAAAKGDFIARMDADDVSHPKRLEEQLSFLNSQTNLAACGCRIHAADALGEGILRYVEWSNTLLHPDEIRRERFVESPVVHPSILIRTEALRAVGGYRDPGWAEDYDLWLRMLDAGMEIGKHPDVLLDWHDRADRLTRADPRYTEDEFLRAKAHFLNRLPGADERGFQLCGAGPIGKRLGRFLQGEGSQIHTYFEVHPRRVGERIHGVPVLHHGAIPHAAERPKTQPYLICAVGRPAARQRVRSQLCELGYLEGTDFFAAS